MTKQRKRLDTMKQICNVIVLCLVLSCVEGGSGKQVGNAELKVEHDTSMARYRREGLGPWEGQDAWNEEGKSNVKIAIDTIVGAITNETKVLEELMSEAAEAIAHPVQTLWKTKVGRVMLFVLVAAILMIVVRLLVFAWPAVRVLLRILWWPFSCLFKGIKSLKCCMLFCACRPCVWVRNLKRKISNMRYDHGMPLVEEEQYVGFSRMQANPKYDEYGMYVTSDGKTRIYLGKDERLEMNLMNHKGVGVVGMGNKETLLAGAKFRKVGKLPDFQGQFRIGDTVVGQFARVNFRGKDCLITAYHVLKYNRSSVIKIANGKNEIIFNDVRASILAISGDSEFDYIIMEVPSAVFSKLGLKQGKISPRISVGAPIVIYQTDGDDVLASSGIVRKHPNKPWFVEYGASTSIGSSGAPVLDYRKNIVGVHIESCAERGCNVGVIPPIFRNKESYTNEELVADEPDYEQDPEYDEYDPEEYDRKMRDILAQEDYYMSIVMRERDQDVRPGSWAAQMDELDDLIERRFGEEGEYQRFVQDKARVFRTKANNDQHSGDRIKRGRLRKESPWTCSRCGLLHLKAGYNCSRCGYALIKMSKVDEKILRADVKSQVSDIPSDLVARVVEETVRDYLSKVNLQDMLEQTLRKKGVVKGIGPSAGSLPDRIEMTKDLATKLRVTNPAFGREALGVNKFNRLTVKKFVENDDRNSDYEDQAPTYLVDETPVAKVELTKNQRRRLNRRLKKEAAIVVNEDLNSLAPLRGGANTGNGLNLKDSLAKAPYLENRNVPSLAQASVKKVASGLSVKIAAHHANSMGGQTGAQKPRN